MHRKVLLLTAIPAFLFSLLIISCNKLDTTDIGSGLIPPVDNVNTFDTTLEVDATQGTPFNDSTLLASTDDHVIGNINDPIFGKTTATLFLELKPTVYPYYWGNAGDTIENLANPNGLPDSVVFCLGYKGFYGDSTTPQQITVRAISNTVTDFKDSAYRIGKYYPAVGNVLGTKTVNPLTLRNWVIFSSKKDSAINQIRIPITDVNFIKTLFHSDSTATGTNNAFYSDSVFRKLYKGFAISVDTASSGTRGLFYVSPSDANTRLEFHFRKRTAGTGVKDTIVNSLRFNTTSSSTVSYSARAQYIRRDRTGSPSSLPDASAIYIQTTPGTYADLTIPLTGLYNRIIHRAELILEKVPDINPGDTALAPPSFLYVDVIDTPNVHWKPVPFDLSPNESYGFYPGSGSIDFTYFGGYVRKKADPNNPAVSMSYYNFNLSRYVQHLLTSPAQYPNFKLRLYAPYQLNYPEFFFGPVSFANSIAYGRVRLGSKNNPNYKLRMRIIYSKI